MAQENMKSLYDRLVKGKEDAVRAAARKDVSDEELARLLGCNVSLLRKLKKGNLDFCDLLKIDRQLADNIVEESLFHRAVGYDNEEVVTITRKSEKVGSELRNTPTGKIIGDVRLTEISFSVSKAREKEIWEVLRKLDNCTVKRPGFQVNLREVAKRIRRIDVTTAFSQLLAICKEHLRI